MEKGADKIAPTDRPPTEGVQRPVPRGVVLEDDVVDIGKYKLARSKVAAYRYDHGFLVRMT